MKVLLPLTAAGLFLLLFAGGIALSSGGTGGGEPLDPGREILMDNIPEHYPTVTLGGGCFWCIEAVLQRIDGIHGIVSGYMGGTVENPTYQQITTGTTGHAEVVQFRYNPEEVSYEGILEWFWQMHDPTTLNRQGNDVGPQYRSVIFTHTEEQDRIARQSREAAGEARLYPDPIVTEITPASTFWPAEDYHQNYYNQNSQAGYCRFVILPKLQKLELK